jgi:hypothetical protein
MVITSIIAIRKMKQIILYLFLLLGISASAQQFSIGVRGGYGNSSMDLLKDFQLLRTNQLEFPLKITENYPATPFYRAEAALNNIKYIGKIALFYGYYSTGARSTVSDYSGRIDLDAVINGHQIGLTIQKDFYNKGNWSFGAYGDASWLFSNLKTTDNLQITFPAEISEKQDYKLISNGFSLEPGAFAAYQFKSILFQFNLGFMFDHGGKLHVEGNKDMMIGVNNEPVTSQWQGFRLGLQVSYLFNSVKMVEL